MNDTRLDELDALARRLHRLPTRRITPHVPAMESAIAELMNATFEEKDEDRKTRLAAIEYKLRLMRNRVLVRERN